MKLKIFRLLALAGTASLVLGSALHGAVASAASSSPVRIDDCVSAAATPAITFPSLDNFPELNQPAMPAMLIVDYVNTSSTPIARIDFGLIVNGKLAAMVRDVGTFAPQARIMHAFGVENNDLPNLRGAMSCVPLRIRYADGTSWTNPAHH